jgi:hypothetical protein
MAEIFPRVKPGEILFLFYYFTLILVPGKFNSE